MDAGFRVQGMRQRTAQQEAEWEYSARAGNQERWSFGTNQHEGKHSHQHLLTPGARPDHSLRPSVARLAPKSIPLFTMGSSQSLCRPANRGPSTHRPTCHRNGSVKPFGEADGFRVSHVKWGATLAPTNLRRLRSRASRSLAT